MSKEILIEITHYMVYDKPADDGSEGPMMTFYRDGTYICNHWSEDSTSLWKMIDGVMWVNHAWIAAESGTWQRCDNNPSGLKISQLVDNELSVEKLLTGNLGV